MQTRYPLVLEQAAIRKIPLFLVQLGFKNLKAMGLIREVEQDGVTRYTPTAKALRQPNWTD